MSALSLLRLLTISLLVCAALGVFLGFLTKRLPMRGWAALLALLVTALGFIFVEPASDEASTRVPLMFLFMLLAPVAVIYSIFAFKRAPDRIAALAGLVGAIVVGLLFLFALVGALLALAETFTA